MTINMNSDPSLIQIESQNVKYTDQHIISEYEYHSNKVIKASSKITVKPQITKYQFKTGIKVPTTGLMIVGWGGNNGSTLTASICANKKSLSWHTKEGAKQANYFGSMIMSSTVKLGLDENGDEFHHKFSDLLPMTHPNDFVIGGWDINKANLKQAMQRAKVLDYDLQKQLYDELEAMTPLPSVYDADFIALNQEDRADNLIKGDKQQQLQQIISDINEFKAKNKLDKVIVVWSANTERFSRLIDGVNDTCDNIVNSIAKNHSEISPSTLFAVACILTQTPFINGSPQNTFVPGVIQLAEKHNSFIGGDDFKSGQTKLKSVMVDFLVNAGIKPVAITSYNHLGNNDGKNLSAPEQFRSKEISKSSVVDDMVAANHILYKPGEHPDHTVVIKYVPSVGDSKRALDEYVSEIFMGGLNTISVYNICEDSLLASPLIIDLVVVTELMTRVEYRTAEKSKFAPFHPVLSILSYMLKAPLVSPGTPVINSLYKQRAAIQNIFRAFIGLQPENDMLLEHKTL